MSRIDSGRLCRGWRRRARFATWHPPWSWPASATRFCRLGIVSTTATPLPDGAAAGEAVKAEITGDLTIHGVTKRVTIPVDVRGRAKEDLDALVAERHGRSVQD